MKTCPTCRQALPQSAGRLICSQCDRAIVRGSGGWTHGPDGRPRHNDCEFACNPAPAQGIMNLPELN